MRKILIIVDPEFEDIEVLYPLYRFREEGWEVHIASYTKELVSKFGYRVKVNKLLKEVNPEEYDVLAIPGGHGPEGIRLFAKEDTVRSFLILRLKMNGGGLKHINQFFDSLFCLFLNNLDAKILIEIIDEKPL